MKTNLRPRLAQNEALLGIGLMFACPGIVEGACRDWDWLWVDGQHGQHTYETMLASVRLGQALGLGVVCRVPSHEPGFIGRVMDMAPDGLMAPMVNSPAEAQAIVRAMRFPPLGERSFGGRRVIDIGTREYYQTEGDSCLGVVQIETLEAVAQAEAIAAVDGVDVLFFGPDDMKVRMGLPINTPLEESETLQAAMAQTAAAARKAGKFVGCVAPTPAAVHAARGMGYQLIVGGADITFLRTTATERLAALRAALTDQLTKTAGPAAGPAAGAY